MGTIHRGSSSTKTCCLLASGSAQKRPLLESQNSKDRPISVHANVLLQISGFLKEEFLTLWARIEAAAQMTVHCVLPIETGSVQQGSTGYYCHFEKRGTLTAKFKEVKDFSVKSNFLHV